MGREDVPIFILLSSPDQELKTKYVTPPVDDFKTGFRSWSVKGLGEYMQARYRERKTQEHGFYDTTTIAVLDERSTKDRTIDLGKYTIERREVPEDPDYGPPAEWQSVRIRFDDISTSVGCATLKSFLFFGEESIGLVDESGVWTMPS